MAIPNVVLSKTQFEYLANNIVNQTYAVASGADIAQTGLDYVVQLDDAAPSVDLVNPLYDHMVRMDGVAVDNIWAAVCTSLNTHAINRYDPTATGTVSTRLNAYFANKSIQVPQKYADLSEIGGFVIDGDYIL
jgi:hypothetical protein